MQGSRLSKLAATGMVAAGLIGTFAVTIGPASAQGGYGRYNPDRPGVQRREPNSSWSEIDKTPNFDSRSRAGFYVWREGNTVYIVSNARNRDGDTTFSGEATVQGGSVSNVSGYRTEGDDRFRQSGDNRVSFRFTTDNGLDGVKFNVNGGRRIIIRFQSGNYGETRVFLGRDKIQTRQDPLVIAK